MKNGNGVKLKIKDVKNANEKAVVRSTNKTATLLSIEEVAKIFGVTVRTIQYWLREGIPVTAKRKNCGTDWGQKYREYKARLAEIELKANVSTKLRSEKNDIIDSVNMGVKLIELCEDHLIELSESYFDKNRGNIILHPKVVERLITTLQIGTQKIRIAIGEKN